MRRLQATRRALRSGRLQRGFSWMDLRAALFRSGSVACCAALAPGAAWMSFGSDSDDLLPQMAVGTVGAAAGFVGAVYLFRHPIREELALLWAKVRTLRGV